MFQVSEIYRAMQGEGWHSGMPCTLIRLQGCNLRCPFCDTKYTWDPKGGESMTLQELSDRARLYHHDGDIFLITGGEPTMQPNLDHLAAMLRSSGPVHLETSGTLPLPNSDSFSWITVSPKPPHIVNPALYARANELKWLVGTNEDVDALRAWLKKITHRSIHVCVQPISGDTTATRICYDACLAFGFRLSLQLHKIIGVD